MKILLVALLAITLVGCANYQVGDATERYCEEASPVTKYLLRNAVRERLEDYPASGVCTDLYWSVPYEYQVPE